MDLDDYEKGLYKELVHCSDVYGDPVEPYFPLPEGFDMVKMEEAVRIAFGLLGEGLIPMVRLREVVQNCVGYRGAISKLPFSFNDEVDAQLRELGVMEGDPVTIVRVGDPGGIYYARRSGLDQILELSE